MASTAGCTLKAQGCKDSLLNNGKPGLEAPQCSREWYTVAVQTQVIGQKNTVRWGNVCENWVLAKQFIKSFIVPIIVSHFLSQFCLSQEQAAVKQFPRTKNARILLSSSTSFLFYFGLHMKWLFLCEWKNVNRGWNRSVVEVATSALDSRENSAVGTDIKL